MVNVNEKVKIIIITYNSYTYLFIYFKNIKISFDEYIKL